MLLSTWQNYFFPSHLHSMDKVVSDMMNIHVDSVLGLLLYGADMDDVIEVS
jgi:hypothetical protein